MTGLCEAQYGKFKISPMFETLVKSCGPKMITVSREGKGDKSYKLDGTVMIGRSRENDHGDDYVQLPDDHKVSREHCKIDAGTLTVLVTDLGSSKGTRLDAKDGKKVMSKVRPPRTPNPPARAGSCAMGGPLLRWRWRGYNGGAVMLEVLVGGGSRDLRRHNPGWVCKGTRQLNEHSGIPTN